MLKNWFFLGFCFWISVINAQESNSLYQSFNAKISKDSIALPHKKLNNSFFEIKSNSGSIIEESTYVVNFKTGKILFKQTFENEEIIEINYLLFPDFISKTYSIYDDEKIVPNEVGNLFVVKNPTKNNLKPFDGLNTNGSITRGITIGNNQNSVINSNLDLQITGKIAENINLRASIQDSNIPLQEGGYSQKLDEFDQIFIELFSNKWNIRAGDLFLENRKSTLMNFNKKVQGLSSKFSFGTDNKETEVFAAAALVRGQYAKSILVGQEGNQGPYKLRGNNGELYVLVISGSERVFVNGILKKRGENEDYIIDYNAGEIVFTSLFPVTSEMRITIEYQYTDRNYTRFVTHAGITHEQEKWSIGGFLYSENDVKNQPLQQNLSENQIDILQNAGDISSLMNASSAYLDSYSENKILYKKEVLSGIEIFVYSNNPDDELYNVKFTLVGQNQGNYIITNSQAIGKIYEYISPISGISQGNYEPIIPLIAPTKKQIATLIANYNPSEKTNIELEAGISQNDLNLYSSINDDNNKGTAVKINTQQRLFSKKIKGDIFSNYQYIHENFRTIERLFSIEFDRDWNITNPQGKQSIWSSGLHLNYNNNGFTTYTFEKLQFGDAFSAIKNKIDTRYSTKKINFSTSNSILNSNGAISNTKFIRSQTQLKLNHHKNWLGASLNHENNLEKINTTNTISSLSQKFSEIGASIGRGDSIKTFAEIGYLYRQNDSLQNNIVKRVNTSNSIYLNSQLIKSEKNNLSVFINYRLLNFENPNTKNQNSLNSRISYTGNFMEQMIQMATLYENNSGTIAQQEFTFIEVEPGQGIYTWNDYNNNGIQELQEFETAPFSDLARYVKVFLPNQIFIPTHQNRFSQTLNITFNKWQNKKGFLKFLSFFTNQTSCLIEKKIKRNNENTFSLNPFSENESDIIGQNINFRNSFYYNRGKQNHSSTLNFLQNTTKSLLSSGAIETKNKSYQFQYQHLVKKQWLYSFSGKTSYSFTNSENYPNRNFEISGFQLEPKISYLFSKNASFDLYYEYQNKQNQIGLKESLKQNTFGIALNFNSEKGFTFNGELSLYNNSFEGNPLSAVGFQLLEGLQNGQNQTWRLLAQKNLTSYLDININYQGRKSETSKTIHTGNIQLRAFF